MKLSHRGKPFLSLETRIVLLAVGLFCAGLSVVGIVTQATVLSPYIEQLGDKAMSIARTVASIPDIVENVGKPGAESIIQPLADGIRKKTDVEFVVVMDSRSVRYSHPVPERIGKTFVGGDEGPALQGKEYISNSIGTLGPSMRAFVPIIRGGKVVGAVSVGILIKDIKAMQMKLLRNLFIALILGLFVSIIGARFLAKSIKKEIKGLEPYQITRLLMERETILNSIREGILACDSGGRISLLNEQAQKLLNLNGSAIGKHVSDVFPKTKVMDVIKTGQPIVDREARIGSRRLMVSTVPLKEGNRIVGAISSFRDMTEFEALAEELTGVKRFVDALRVRTHEFLNKLHTILGLIHLRETERAIAYISDIITDQRESYSFITRKIKNPFVGGLLIGKFGRCKELGIKFNIDPDSYLGNTSQVETNALVTIIGNLLENAIQAVMHIEKERRVIDFAIFEESGKIIISVRDTGHGIPEEYLDRIFEKGFSMREEGQGIGLFNVKEIVDIYGGEISVESKVGCFTEFVVTLTSGGQ